MNCSIRILAEICECQESHSTVCGKSSALQQDIDLSLTDTVAKKLLMCHQRCESVPCCVGAYFYSKTKDDHTPTHCDLHFSTLECEKTSGSQGTFVQMRRARSTTETVGNGACFLTFQQKRSSFQLNLFSNRTPAAGDSNFVHQIDDFQL